MKLLLYQVPPDVRHKFTLSHVQLTKLLSRLITEGWLYSFYLQLATVYMTLQMCRSSHIHELHIWRSVICSHYVVSFTPCERTIIWFVVFTVYNVRIFVAWHTCELCFFVLFSFGCLFYTYYNYYNYIWWVTPMSNVHHWLINILCVCINDCKLTIVCMK